MKQRYLAALLTGFALFLLSPFLFGEEPVSQRGETSTTEAILPVEIGDPLLEQASAIGDLVAEIRGLPLLEPIPKGIKSRDQLRAMLLERFEEEVPDEEFRAIELVYKRLGLMPEDLDYRQLMIDLLTEQIAGFYDQDAKELYIMEGLPEAIQGPTMAHEIFHAIQDQHFDIGAMLEAFSSDENGDFALARMALIEGDAFVLMFDYQLWEMGIFPSGTNRSVADNPAISAMILQLDPESMTAVEQLSPSDAPSLGTSEVPSLTDSVLGNAPPIVRDVLLFPYVGGMNFVLRARAGRTWESFNEIYGNAPASTSHILHPERYFEGDSPLELRFDPHPAIPDYERIYQNVLGELQTRSWLTTLFKGSDRMPAINDIAAQWDGDRLMGFEGPNEEVIVVHVSTWRSTEGAQHFARTLQEATGKRHEAEGVHSRGENGESWCFRLGEDQSGERVLIERWGELVLYIEGAPSKLDEAGRETLGTTFLLRDAVWDSLLRVPFQEVLEKRKRELANP